MSTELNKRPNEKPEKMAERPTVAPPVDIYENKDEVLIFADVPGVGQEDLTVNLEKDQLTIEARRNASGDTPAFDYRRTFVVPRGIDADHIGANLQAGVLKLTLPKSPALKPRQIAVTSG